MIGIVCALAQAGHIVPREIMLLEPWYTNFFYNMATVQFDHRLIAWLLAIVVPLFAWQVRMGIDIPRAARVGTTLLLVMLVVQVSLGIATLLLAVPLALAAAHQAGAVLLFAAALNVAHALR